MFYAKSMFYAKILIHVGFIVAFFIACNAQAELEVKTSQSDTRRFDYLVLDNGLKVFLISDPQAHKAAVALDINVGSGEDPIERQGLAHFLEHMLFLGTKTYSTPGEFQDFISGHGGSHNAQTGLQHTNYYFDIDPEFLAPATQRFAKFFYEPLFLPEYVERERLAVHSEYASKLSVASRRDRDVISSLMRKDHPLAKFYTGNNETLGKGEPEALREDLLAFYQRFYSANLMAVAISGPQDLSELKKIAQKNFSPIANKKIALPDNGRRLFPDNFLPAEVHIRAQKERRKLSLLFPVPSEKDYEDLKPLRYIGNFIGHEGKGSLLSVLRTHNLATGLSAGTAYKWRGGQAFSVDIALTKKGAREQALIYRLVFAYLDRLRSKGVDAWRYDELRQLDQIRFNYGEQGNPRREVSRIAAVLHERLPENIYWSSYRWQMFDKDLIDTFLSFLTPENALTVYVSDEVEGDSVSPFYDTPYALINDGERLSQAGVDQTTFKALSKALALPKKNTYISNDFTIFGLSSEVSKKHPSVIFSRHQSRGWFLNDDITDVPKGFIKTRVWLPMIAESAENFVVARLYTRIIDDALSEISYDAALAGLSYSLQPSTRGIDINFYGYNDGLKKLVKRVLKTIRTFKYNSRYRQKLSATYFDQAKTDLLRSLQNTKFAKLYSQTIRKFPVLLYSPYWSDEQIQETLLSIDQQKFEQKVKSLFQQAQFESFVFGNFEERQANIYFKQVARILKPKPDSEIPKTHIVNLNAQPNRYFQTFNSTTDESVLALYVQGTDASLQERAAIMLLEQMVSTAFYRVLRTEKQLGYIVFTSNYRLREVPGILSVVQSPSHQTADIYRNIDDFFKSYKQEVMENFERDRDALLTKLEEPPKNQGQWLDFYWGGILDKDLKFDEKERLIEALEAVDSKLIEQRYEALFSKTVFHLALASDPGSPSAEVQGSKENKSEHEEIRSIQNEKGEDKSKLATSFAEFIRSLTTDEGADSKAIEDAGAFRSSLPRYSFD